MPIFIFKPTVNLVWIEMVSEEELVSAITWFLGGFGRWIP